MKPTIKHTANQQLNQSQRLTVTKELQQAIQLLQYPFIELKDYLMQRAMENPFLQIENSDYYFEQSTPLQSNNGQEGKDMNQPWVEQLPNQQPSSLKRYLYDQIISTYRKTPIRDMMIQLIDEIDEDGYLNSQSPNVSQWEGDHPVIFLDALTLIHQLDPAGVGARSLKECLMIQADQDPSAPPKTYEVLHRYFDEFINEQWETITHRTNISQADLEEMLDYVHHLTPRPGLAYGEKGADYLYPEIIIQSDDQGVTYQLNRSMMPRVTFNQEKFATYQQNNDPELQYYLAKMRQDYDWLNRSLTQREETLAKLAEGILHFQGDYFQQKNTLPQGLTMAKVAQWMDVHESTVSRLVKDKYIDVNGEIIPLRFFFPAVVNQSTDATKDHIKQALEALIKEESPSQPYSDQQLSELLKEQGLTVARRTVSQYRNELDIPSASQRKIKP